jgi:trimethylamine--corrinoid protein Co-methyltransferase
MQLAALAGANMIYGLGMIDLGMTLDFSQLVVDNEIAKMTRRILEGIPVSSDTLAVEVIR